MQNWGTTGVPNGHGFKLMVLAIVVGIGSNIFGTIVTPAAGAVTLNHAVATILAALAVFGLAIFVPGIAAGLVTGAPQLGAGAAVATTAGAVGSGVAAGAFTLGAARLAGRLGGGGVRAAASLTGTVTAAHEQGGMRGVAAATIIKPAAGIAESATAPVRDAFRQGAAYGYRATASGSAQNGGGAGGSPSSGAGAEPPAWAQRLSRRQRMRDATFVAGQALREGDRPMAPASPDLKDDKG
jgi:type IV secretion system protein TrbL